MTTKEDKAEVKKEDQAEGKRPGKLGEQKPNFDNAYMEGRFKKLREAAKK